MRTRKEREKFLITSAEREGKKLSRIEKKAWVAIYTVEDIRDLYQLKRNEVANQMNELILQNDVAEERLRTASEDDRGTMEKCADEIQQISRRLSIIERTVDILRNRYFLLDEFAALLNSSLVLEHWKTIYKAAQDKKLDRLIRKENAAEKISKIINDSLDQHYKAARDHIKANLEHKREADKRNNIDKKARELMPSANETIDNIIRKVREKKTTAEESSISVSVEKPVNKM